MSVTAQSVKFKVSGATVTLLDVLFPVGSTYLTYSNVNPGTFLGGSWSLFSENRYLRGGASNAAVGGTGGSNVMSVDQMPSHNHVPYYEGATITPDGMSANDDTPSRQFTMGGGRLWTSSAMQGPSKRLLLTKTGGGHLSTLRTQRCSLGDAPLRGDSPCCLTLRGRGITAPSLSGESTSARRTRHRPRYGLEPSGLASLRAPSSSPLAGARREITPLAKPEGPRALRSPSLKSRRITMARRRTTVPKSDGVLEATRAALYGTATCRPSGLRTHHLREAAALTRTGLRTSQSISGSEPNRNRKAVIAR